jgi:pimeloyl-ACP methyl ester carboxylesterase
VNSAGFVPAFVSTMRQAPIYAPQADWVVLGELLAERRGRRGGEEGRQGREQQQQHSAGDGTDEVNNNKTVSGTGGIRGLDLDAGLGARMGLVRGKVLLVLGRDDPVVVPGETVEDAEKVLGKDGVEAVILDAGHELPMAVADQVADCICRFIC